ncbi:MAG: substrate-binding periplasmic protein [Telluria sp.]
MKFLTLLLALAALARPAAADDLTFAIQNGSDMPMTHFRDGALVGGILKELGDAIGRELGLHPRYITVPRKRVEAAVLAGEADLVCDLRPEWLNSPALSWSQAILGNNMIVAGLADTPPLQRIEELANRRVGTLLGYRYPRIEAALGARFQRDDSVNDAQNLGKLLRRRFDYLVTNSIFYDYQLKVHPDRDQLQAHPFLIRQFDTYCALGPAAKRRLPALDNAITALKRRGAIQGILEQFRPSGAGMPGALP